MSGPVSDWWWFLGPAVRSSASERPSSPEVQMPTTTTHKCPAPDCEVQVGREQLTCRPHWYSLPAEIRGRVWSGYRSNNAERHNKAMADAISFLRARSRV